MTLDSSANRAISKIKRDLGSLILNALDDPDTVEILLNPDGILWHEKLGKSMEKLGNLSIDKSQAIIETIAGFHSKEVTKKNPILECELPLDGSRFSAQIPPIVTSPTFAIRKRAIAVYTLDDYVNSGIMSPSQREIIKNAVIQHKNILVIGGTGSGKTTLVNAIIKAMVVAFPYERLVIIEDTNEIQCTAANYIQYHSTINTSMTMLLKTTLRMRPDRILVGEVRGAEALDLLMAWNTGHGGGSATLHANNALAGLSKLAMLISMNNDAPRVIEPLIAEAVDYVVCIQRTPEKGRKITEIIEVQDFCNNQYIYKTLH